MRSRATGRRADANWVNSMAAVPSTLDMVVFSTCQAYRRNCDVPYGTAHTVRVGYIISLVRIFG